MKAGRHYVGDLCYVLGGVWHEVCALTNGGAEGEFTLKDGRKFAMFNTAYGDGVYSDQDERKYPVDSGTLGCMLTSECGHAFDDGQEIDFPEDFEVTKEGGLIKFGNIVSIDTDH